MTSTTDLPAPRRILVIDEDRAVNDLLATWLAAEGHDVVRESADDGDPEGHVDLVVVDVPYPRRRGVDWIRRVAERHPMTPILALSCTLFAGVECGGPVARSLGANCVLPKPVSRQALLQQVQHLLAR
jgi:DNA-binding response OmpR family regulator